MRRINSIGDAGAVALSGGLAGCAALLTLDLGCAPQARERGTGARVYGHNRDWVCANAGWLWRGVSTAVYGSRGWGGMVGCETARAETGWGQ